MTDPSRQQLLNAALRQDLQSFIHKSFTHLNSGEPFLDNWHIDTIAYHLELCYRREIKRLIITLPPRSLKSVCASVAFPAWVLGQDPTSRIICVSYGQSLANHLALQGREIIGSDWYRGAFPGTRAHQNRNTEAEFMTTQMGGRYATSVGGTLTGRGGDFIIIDDPIKPDGVMSEADRNTVNRWYDNTLYSRLNNRNEGVIIIIMQRLHEDDLVGHVLTTEDWVRLDIPAIAEQRLTYNLDGGKIHTREPGDVLHEARENRAALDQVRSVIGSRNFAAQYQQTPVPAAGNLIRREWIHDYQEALPLDRYQHIVQSWDPAASTSDTACYSVGMTFGILPNLDVHLLDVIRERMSSPDLISSIEVQAERYNARTVLIEDAGIGIGVFDTVRARGNLRGMPIARRPMSDKVSRMEAQLVHLENGTLRLPADAPFRDVLVNELLAFPSGRFADQVDALSQFLDWYTNGPLRTRTRHDRATSRKQAQQQAEQQDSPPRPRLGRYTEGRVIFNQDGSYYRVH